MVKSQFFSQETDPMLSCPCCGSCELSPDLLARLDQARVTAGIPFNINSGYRCEAHNAEVGGKPTSSHLGGFAVDISADNSPARAAILNGLIAAGFERIGIAKTFIHVDMDPSKLAQFGPVLWLYS